MTIEFDTSGLAAAFDNVKKRALDAAAREMGDAMDDLREKAVNLAPLDKGTLRGSAWTEVATKGDVVTGEVYFNATENGPKGRVNYALIVHEMGEFKNPTTPGTQPKFLENPLKANAERYVAEIDAAVRKELT